MKFNAFRGHGPQGMRRVSGSFQTSDLLLCFRQSAELPVRHVGRFGRHTTLELHS